MLGHGRTSAMFIIFFPITAGCPYVLMRGAFAVIFNCFVILLSTLGLGVTDYLVGMGGWAYFRVLGKSSLEAYSEVFNLSKPITVLRVS